MSKLDKLDERMAELRAQREELVRVLEEVQKRIEAQDQLIKGFEQLRNSVPESVLVPFLESKKSTQIDDFIEARPVPDILSDSAQTPLDYAMKAKYILEEVGRPLKRGQLVREFDKRKLFIPGKDRNKNLGTIMWRHPSLIVSIPKVGYWSKSVPLPGIYDPDTFVAPSADDDSDGSE